MTEVSDNRPSVFEYINYRAFLNDSYQHLHAIDPAKYSFQFFSGRAKRSKAHLKHVIDSRYGLKPDVAIAYAKVFCQTKKEQRFFMDLVEYNQAKSATALKLKAFERLRANQHFRKAFVFDVRFHDYMSDWRHFAVRELTGVDGFEGDPQWVATRLRPTISEEDATQSLALLEQLGQVSQNNDGRYATTQEGHRLLSTGEQVQFETDKIDRDTFVMTVRNHHKQMASQGQKALDTVPSEERYYQVATRAMSPERFKELRAQIDDLVKSFCNPAHDYTDDSAPVPPDGPPTEILDKADDNTSSVSVVYQLNVQLFPLSVPIEPEPDSEP